MVGVSPQLKLTGLLDVTSVNPLQYFIQYLSIASIVRELFRQ